ncbi:hypothetical protein FXN63_16680 [Pigmentiphaga aceris]|uniref:Uncharacterized protein n=1 Tax=Pigmentiphaga aceris TaxID=1940612 RepID=A0A5C0AXV8_9BURK|nr:hypothetical protein [Pigmentiphaga aceris]QEI07299.1 hypothetical protein FXN63_16680 [Pigmentiphaga aceris]
MNANDILSLLGTRADDERVQALLTRLGTPLRPKLPVEDYRFHDWIMIPELGIELGFSDSQLQSGGFFYLWGSGDILLTQVYFYANFEGIDPYQGELPYGLSMEDSRDAVRAKLAAFEASRHSGLKDTWDVDGYRMSVTYDEDELAVAGIACLAVPAPVKRLREFEPPAIEAILKTFGDPPKPVALKPVWPAGWDDEALGLALDDGELDMTDSYGVTLTYARKNGKQGLRTIALHRNGDLASPGWTGELPAGLDFEDSPDTLLTKLQTKPMYHIDGELAGLAVWTLPDYTLHVLYSNLHGRLQRVSLIAPGPWRPADVDVDVDQQLD